VRLAWTSDISVSQSDSERRNVSAPTRIAVDHDRKMPAIEMARIRPALQLQRLGFLRLLAVGRGWIGIAAIGADQAVDHRLQSGRRVIPVHRRHDHDAVRGDP
jgi:hypothetical protein